MTQCAVCKNDTPYPRVLTDAQLTTRNPKAKILCPKCGRNRAIRLYFDHKKRMLTK